MTKRYNGWANKQTWEIVLLQDNTEYLVRSIYEELDPNSMTVPQFKKALAAWWSTQLPESQLSEVDWREVTWAFFETCKAENLVLNLRLRVYGEIGSGLVI